LEICKYKTEKLLEPNGSKTTPLPGLKISFQPPREVDHWSSPYEILWYSGYVYRIMCLPGLVNLMSINQSINQYLFAQICNKMNSCTKYTVSRTARLTMALRAALNNTNTDDTVDF